MKALHRRCAGLDVHQQEIVACRRIVAGRKVATEIGRFPTTTQGLFALADWLEDGKITHVAMEATGIYWKPVWRVLYGRFTLIVANAAHIRNVPGRKSDVNAGHPCQTLDDVRFADDDGLEHPAPGMSVITDASLMFASSSTA